MIWTFNLLKPSLALVLAFVGSTMLLADVYEIPIGSSLAVVGGLIALGVVGSLLSPRRECLVDGPVRAAAPEARTPRGR